MKYLENDFEHQFTFITTLIKTAGINASIENIPEDQLQKILTLLYQTNYITHISKMKLRIKQNHFGAYK